MKHLRNSSLLVVCLLGTLAQAQQAVFWTPDLKAYFLRGGTYIKLDMKSEQPDGPPGRISDAFTGLTLTDISSALVMNDKLMFFFKGDEMVPYYFAQDGKPARTGRIGKITSMLPGVWSDGVDAAFMATDALAVLFRGDEFILMDAANFNEVHKGFPQKIKDAWPGLWTEDIGSAVLWKDNKAIFFKGKEMIIWDMTEHKKVAGPVLIADYWKEIWADGYNAKARGAVTTGTGPVTQRKPRPEPKPSDIVEVGLPNVKGVMLKTAPIARTTNEDLFAAQNMDQFVDALPEWGKVYPRVSQTKGAGAAKSLGTVDEGGKRFKKKQIPYSITDTPDEIVTFQPVNGFWLGGLIQEKGLVEGIGSFTEVPIESQKRPRFKITTDLLISDNSRTIENPSSSSVQSALGDLISTAVRSGSKSGSSISYRSTRNFSVEQTALALGLDANYMGGSLKSSLETTSQATRNSFSAIYIEKAFTAKVDLEGRSGAQAFFNDQFTVDDARRLVNRGDMDVNNIPTYLASVTYGRMLVFTITAEASESQIQSALEASYEAAKTGAAVNVAASNLLKSGSTTITVTSIGGPTEATVGLIRSGKIADFFNKDAPLNTMRPISYTVNSLREGRMAAMAKTTEYTATVYEQEKTIIKYKIVGFWEITDSDDGFADDTVECFGDMKINGVTYWSIPSGAAQGYDRASGGRIDLKAPSGGDIILTVDLLSKVPNPTVMEFAGILMDWDRSSGDDELGTCNQKVDIRALAQNGQELILTQGNLSQARFHLRVVEAN